MVSTIFFDKISSIWILRHSTPISVLFPIDLIGWRFQMTAFLSKYLVEILILVVIQKWIWLYIIWSFFIANGSKESSILVYMNQNDNEHIRLWYFKFSYKQLDQFRIQLGNFTHIESFAFKLLLLFYWIQNPINTLASAEKKPGCV